MDALVRRQVERLQRGPHKAVVAVAGGGAQALSWLLATPGASHSILEARVPYSLPALTEFLGSEPSPAVSRKTAEDMAQRSYQRALRLATDDAAIIGVGCTAALTTDRPKKGDHRCFVSGWTASAVTTYGVTLVKGLRDREAEDEVVSRLVLRALAEASDAKFDLSLGLDERESLEAVTSNHGDLIGRLLAGDVTTVTVHPDGVMMADDVVRGGVIPGSFDPFHRGHERLAQVAARVLDAEVRFELSIANVDKPLLDEVEITTRLAQFAGKRPVVLTRASRFYQKSALFPGCTFVVGWDTAVRLVNPEYYGGSEDKMTAALATIRRAGCRFLVAGRAVGEVFHGGDQVPVPAEFEEMFSPIPEEAFRYDVSSTELRAGVARER